MRHVHICGHFSENVGGVLVRPLATDGLAFIAYTGISEAREPFGVSNVAF